MKTTVYKDKHELNHKYSLPLFIVTTLEPSDGKGIIFPTEAGEQILLAIHYNHDFAKTIYLKFLCIFVCFEVCFLGSSRI